MRRVVYGQSMVPSLRTFDICNTIKIQPEEIHPGDLLVYENAPENRVVVHRVLRVDHRNRVVLIKGDNLPGSTIESVHFDQILEKVVSFSRGNREFNLQSFFHKFTSRITAYLSRYDLTPFLLRRKMLDPVLLAITRIPFFQFLRKMCYKDISYVVIRTGDKCFIYTNMKTTNCARVIIESKNKGIFVSSYIRYRDRNFIFASNLATKITHIIKDNYDIGVPVYFTDPVLKKLIKKCRIK